MIKKMILYLLVIALAVSVSVVYGQQGIHEPGTGLTNPEVKEASQGTGQGLQALNDSNVSKTTPGIHEPGTGITNPEIKEAAQGAGEGNQARSGQTSEPSESSPQKTQPGFEAISSLTGMVALSYIILKRRN